MGIAVIGYILALPQKSFVVKGMALTEEFVGEPAVVVGPEVYRIIKCESQWKEDAIGDGGRAYGLAQFHRPTWDWLVKLSGKNLDYYNPQHQIELLDWALENGRGYLWTCWRKLYEI
jgi:hypothetical protein